jgi:DNA polymerase V
VSDVWGIGRKWSKKLRHIGVDSVGQFIMQSDMVIKKMMNVNGLKTKMELTGMYCFPIQKIPKLKRNVASTRSFGQDIDSFDQIAEAMYSYIKSGVKKLTDNGISPNKATIFISGNRHKGGDHHSFKQINFQTQTRDVEEIWSQVYPYLKNMFRDTKKYKKCGIIFNNLMPESVMQTSLFTTPIQLVQPPANTEKKWEMKQDFISQKYTTSWEDIPSVFV